MGNNGSYPIWLQVGTTARAIQVAAWSGASFLSRHIREETKEIKVSLKRQTYRNQVCQSGWNGPHVSARQQHIRRLSKADEGGPHAQTDLPGSDPNYAAPRHHSVVGRKLKEHRHRANSVMWRRQRWGPRTIELNVLGAEGGMPGSWPEKLFIPSWSGMPRISCPIRLDNNQNYRDPRRNPKKSSQDTLKDSREGFMLDMATPRYQGVEILLRTVRKTSSSLWAHQQYGVMV